MYLKMVGNRHDSFTHLTEFETISYVKHVVGDKTEFDTLIAPYDEYWQPYAMPEDEDEGDGFGKPVWIIITNNAHFIILVNGFAYIMNEGGATIDKIR